MSNRLMLTFAAAIVTGAIAAFIGLTVLRDTGPTPARAEEAVVPVAVAARDMDVGTVLGADDIRMVSWPRGLVPEGYTGSASELVDRGLLTPVKTNEALLSSKLASKEAGGGLPIIIPEGKRAMSVKVDEVIGVAGFVTPGTRVDVLVSLGERTDQSEPVTQVVLQGIEVLTAGQVIERDRQGAPVEVPVVTLLVDPEQGEKLALASNEGRIQLALRNTLDMDTVDTPGARLRNLLRPQQVVRSVPRRSSAPRRPTEVSVEVFRGPEKSTETVKNEGEGG